MTFSNDLVISEILKVNTMDIQEQQAFVHRVFEKWNEYKNDEHVFIIFSLKESFFRAMTQYQKERYLYLIVEELYKGTDVNGDMIELVGQLIKYATDNIHSVIQKILLLSKRIHKVKNQICLINFCKYVWDICDENLRLQIQALLNHKKNSRNLHLSEIAADVLYAINSLPIRRKESQIAFVIPEFLTSATFLQQPIDYMRVLSVLYDQGIQGDIIDNRVHNYSLLTLAKMVESYHVIVITSSPIDMVQKYFVDYRYCIFCETVNWLFKRFPNKRIVVCGAHGSVDINLLCKDIKCHQILYGENSKAIISSLAKTQIDDESLLNYPLQLDAIDMNWYYGRKVVNQITYRQKQYSIMQLSQGCPYNCMFCFNIYGQKVNRMSINEAITQLMRLQEIGINHIFFIDQTFTLDCNYILELCKEICDSGIHITWQCETRADLVNPILVQAMKNAGCTAIWLGFESFSQQVLNANNKQLTKQQQLQAIQIINDAGVTCSGFVMLGMVADTLETIQETINTILLHKIPTSRTANLCTVRIGTDLYKRAHEAGLIQINSFCHLEAYRGQLFNNLSEKDLNNALQQFSSSLG